jgi:hypothetical protein
MAPTQELELQQKRELERKEESTTPARIFIPNTDIFESDEALTVVMEMPGVARQNADITMEDGVLTVSGRIGFSKYEKLGYANESAICSCGGRNAPSAEPTGGCERGPRPFSRPKIMCALPHE